MPTTYPTPRRGRRRSVTVLAWTAALCLAPLCLAWVPGEWVYWFDLVASHQLLLGLVTLALALPVLVLRRWRAGLVLAVLGGAAVYPVATGRQWLLPEVDLGRKPAGVVRVVSCNINPLNSRWLDGVHKLLELDADVVMLLELAPEMSREIQHRGSLPDERYPYREFRSWRQGRVSACVILSRWPLERIWPEAALDLEEHTLAARLAHPDGGWIVAAMHPASPRTRVRWEIGNVIALEQARLAAALGERHGEPVVVGADLNAGPAQRRARDLRGEGLRLSKPLIRVGGSFPAGRGVPGMLRIQLDDVLSIGTAGPVAWSMIPVMGSDHAAVVVDFAVE